MTTDIVNPDGTHEPFYDVADEFDIDTLYVVGDDAYIADDVNDLNTYSGEYEILLAHGQWGFDDDRVDLVYDLETSEEDDHTHYRRGGMTQVHAKRAVENDIAVAFNLQLLFTERRSVYMGRMMQNVRICRKYDVPMRIITMAEDAKDMRHPKDLEALGRVLGMTDVKAQEAVDWEG